MKIFDTSYLSVFLNANPPVPKDRAEQPVKFFKERVATLITNLNAVDEIVGVPAPALAELLVRAGAQKADFVSVFNDQYKFEILPFNTRAAIEAAELIEKIKADTKGKHEGTWAKVKFDNQIIAIAKAEGASVIYSDDTGIERCAQRVGIRVLRICDLPYLPPVSASVPVTDADAGPQLSLLSGLPLEEEPRPIVVVEEPALSALVSEHRDREGEQSAVCSTSLTSVQNEATETQEPLGESSPAPAL